MRGLVVMILLAGCATRTVRVAPGVIAVGASEFKQHGRAKIYAEDGKVTTIHDHDKVDVHVRQEGDLQIPMSLTLGEIAAGCEEPGGHCIAERIVEQRLVVKHDHYLDSDLVAKGVGFLSIGGLIGYCLAECQDEGSVGRALGYTGAVIGVTALLFFGAIALGGRD